MEVGSEVVWADEVMTSKHIVRASQLTDKVERIRKHGEDRGVSTGWHDLDQYYTVKTGEMCIVTGVPSHGKSEIVDALLCNLAESQGWKFCLFSPENMPYERHVRKLVEKYQGKSLRKDFRGETTMMPADEMKEGVEWVDAHFMWLDIKQDFVTLDRILEVFCHLADNEGVKGFVIDPWNDIQHKRGDMSETDYISMCLSILREFARVKDVALWIVAHPAKMQRNKQNGTFPVPSLNDIAGSFRWRSMADVGLVAHRPDTSKDRMVLYVQKVRFKSTGRPGEVTFDYDYWSGRFKPVGAPF